MHPIENESMSIRLTKDDYELFSSVAEYRVLSVSQLKILLGRNNRALRRRLDALRAAGHVHLAQAGFGRRGRPETLVSLAGPGVELLRRRGTLPTGIADAHVIGDDFKPLHHQLLVNWFRIHLVHVERMSPRLAVRFLAPTSPFLERGPGDKAPPAGNILLENRSGQRVGFTPDGVFTVTDNEQSKALLFFLEVDRGTERASFSADAARANSPASLSTSPCALARIRRTMRSFLVCMVSPRPIRRGLAFLNLLVSARGEWLQHDVIGALGALEERGGLAFQAAESARQKVRDLAVLM